MKTISVHLGRGLIALRLAPAPVLYFSLRAAVLNAEVKGD